MEAVLLLLSDNLDYDSLLDLDTDSLYTTDSSYQLSAQEQWEESVRQINTLLSFIIFPLVGKLLGRRFAHYVWKNIANWWFI